MEQFNGDAMMRISIDDAMEYAVPLVFGAAFIALFVLLIMATNAEHDKCEAAGGRMVSKSSLGVGPAMGGNGGVAIVPTTVSFCVSADGRILF